MNEQNNKINQRLLFMCLDCSRPQFTLHKMSGKYYSLYTRLLTETIPRYIRLFTFSFDYMYPFMTPAFIIEGSDNSLVDIERHSLIIDVTTNNN